MALYLFFISELSSIIGLVKFPIMNFFSPIITLLKSMFLRGKGLKSNQRAIAYCHNCHAVTPVRKHCLTSCFFATFRMDNWPCHFYLSNLHNTFWYCELWPLKWRLASLFLTRSICVPHLNYVSTESCCVVLLSD